MIDVDNIVFSERNRERIGNLLKKMPKERFQLCVEKALLITEVYRSTEGEPEVIRQAKAIENILHNMPIWIDEDELIVGHPASKPWALELNPFTLVWGEEDMGEFREEINAAEEEGSIWINEKDWSTLVELSRYWRRLNPLYAGYYTFTEKLFKLMEVGLPLPPAPQEDTRTFGGAGAWASNGLDLYDGFHLDVPNFEKVLKCGLEAIIKEAEEELEKIQIFSKDDIEKKNFLEAAVIALNAIIHYANRYANLAEEIALMEKNPVRKRELERIAEVCRRVPAKPARNFYEALQSVWFIYLLHNPRSVGYGRFPQYMYPFYKRDKEAGKITDEQVLALLCELRIKDMEVTRLALRAEKRKQRAGELHAKWHNMLIGGVKHDGADATNELCYLILEAAKRVRTPHHTITVLVHEETPEELMIKALEVVRTGIGMPAFVGDRAYINFLVSKGVPIEVARNYAIGGCLDPVIPGKNILIPASFLPIPKILEVFLNGGVDPRTGHKVGPAVDMKTFRTFEEFYESFKRYLAEVISDAVEIANAQWGNWAKRNLHIVEAALMEDGIKVGKGILEYKPAYDEFYMAIFAVGMINVADSLAVIKKLIYEEKKITWDLLLNALKTNWQGYEEIRRMCLKAPKYGNDHDYVDSIAADLYSFFADEVSKYRFVNGGRYVAGGISISSMWAGGAITGATPDGRFAGEVLADGSTSPVRGRDVNGPTAIIKSAIKIPQIKFSTTLMNMKIHPSALKTTEDLRKLAFLIKTYFKFGGKHIQFNVVSKETLLEAQKHPEQYQNLIVRVAGYSAYFVQLGKPVQDEIIARTEHTL